jgi:hypothetical protein
MRGDEAGGVTAVDQIFGCIVSAEVSLFAF